MPDVAPTTPPYVYTDSDTLSVIKESLDRAITTRMNILAKPKPSYDIDGQKFSWAEYLDQLNKTIEQLRKNLQDFDEPFEFDSSYYF